MEHFTIPTTDSAFQQDVLNSQVPVLVDFWAEWCGPCKAIGPKLEEIARELGSNVKIVKINVDANQKTAAHFKVRSIPTMILFKGGKSVGELLGNQPKDEIKKFIAGHLV